MPQTQDSLSIEEIKKRAISSFMSLTARKIALRGLRFVTINLILVTLLPVHIIGIFNIASALITFFAFFADVGLAASLIQKKEAVSDDDIKTTFTIQQLLVGVLSGIIILGAPTIGAFYNLDYAGIWLIRILGLSFFLSSLKVIPTVVLERQLRFQPLVAVEVVEAVILNCLLIILAYLNFGLWSFTYAALAQGIVGLVLIYILVPVKLGIGVKVESAKGLLSFGIPYQINSLLALLKDRLVPLVVAKMVGTSGMAYITWSVSIALFPLEIMGDILRVTFPAFSRLQDNKDALSKAVEKSLFITTLIIYPMLFGLAAIIPFIAVYIMSSKMEPAVASFYLFAFSSLWATVSTTFTNTLNAVGKVKSTLKLMVLWTVLTWILTPVLVYFYGFVGVGISSFLISFTSVLSIILVKRFLTVRVANAILLPTVASIIMFAVVYAFSVNFLRNYLTLISAVAIGVLTYTAVIFIFGKDRVLKDLRTLKNG